MLEAATAPGCAPALAGAISSGSRGVAFISSPRSARGV